MTKEQVLLITNGDQLAANFVQAFVNWCHTLDDLIDRDKPCGDERMIKDFIVFQSEMLLNPWVQQRQLLLMPLIIMSFNAWLDANRWEKEGGFKSQDADVIKGFYHEVVWYCAYLCGGWEHYRAVTSTYREYDHETKFNDVRSIMPEGAEILNGGAR